jgi:hypothetical protein
MFSLRTKKDIYIFTILILVFCIVGKAFAMSSSKYQINTDSINMGGTEDGVAGDFILSDTLGEVNSGVSSSSRYSVSSGYRILQSSYISISAVSDVVLPEMSGMVSGQSESAESWLVTTDNFAGYEILVRSSTAPALRSLEGASFSDYAPLVTDIPDYIFSIAPTSSAFAFSPEGQDISSKYLDNGSVCGVGNFDTSDRCWDGFSTNEKAITYRTSSNHPDGTVTTIKYKSGIGSNKIQDSGAYSATIIVTAVVL